MSLILDALRKMELERKAKRQSSQEIRAEVLYYRGTSAAPGKSRIVTVTAALLLIFAAAACFFYLGGGKSPWSDAVKAAGPVQREQLPVMPPAQSPPLETPQQKTPPLEGKTPPEAPRSAEKTENLTEKPAADEITVSGIAWQEERYLRRAVINGSLVGEGAEIQGAKVVEIRENRVRFSRGGEIFEVAHTSGSGR